MLDILARSNDVFDKDGILVPVLCVPNIRFSMDAENRRGKFAT
jgi:hypothetical protein